MGAVSKDQFAAMNSRQKKQLRVTITGRKTIPIFDYIDMAAKSMPVCKHKQTKKHINHVKMMRELYMQHGIEAVEKYKEMIVGATLDKIAGNEKTDDSNGHIRAEDGTADQPKVEGE